MFYVHIYYYEVLVWREFICNKSMIIGGGEIRELNKCLVPIYVFSEMELLGDISKTEL